MNLLGIDLGSQYLKSVEIQRNSDGTTELISLSKVDISGLDMFSGKVFDPKPITDFLRDYVMQNKYIGKSVNLGLPSSLTYIRIDSFPKLTGKELENAVNLELQNQTVVPLAESSVSFQVLPNSGNTEKTDVLSVIAPKTLTNNLLAVIKDSGLNLQSIEPNVLGTIRGVLNEEAVNPATVVLDIGYKFSDISVFADNALRFTRNVPTGMSSLIKTVAQGLNLEVIQAEEYIKTYGLSAEKLNGKVRDAAASVITLLLDEVKRSNTFYETRGGSSKIKRLVLAGGGAYIPGLVVHAANYLGLEVEIANPWDQIRNLGAYSSNLADLEPQAPLYTTSVGLSLKKLLDS
ncbi:type IV pilus assembly protein PilM [bacterium]|nr:type IV pilus assembly protein PilM [bacterium]